MPSIEQPQITVVIPTYRRPRLLARAISSAIQQEGVRVRVHVFDNASGDETADVVRSFAAEHPDVLYHCHERNLGAAANFLFALRSIGTDCFSILSDDDYLLPGFYRSAMQGFEAHPSAMFWAGLTLVVDEVGTIWDARVLRWPREGLFEPPEGMLAMTGGLAPTWTGIVFRREVLDSIGLPDPQVQGPADLDFVLRAAGTFPFVLEKQPSAVFTLNSASFSETQPLASFWPGWQKMFRNLAAMPGLADDARARLMSCMHADAQRMLFRRSANALAKGRVDFARDGAAALQAAYSGHVRGALLRSLAWTCSRIPGAQGLYTAAYRMAERKIVASRADLQARFGGLLRAG